MDVLLTDEEKMLRDTAREFLEAECPTTLVREMETDPKGYPPALWRKAAELGWQGMALPEKYGGQDLPLVYLGLILQEAGRALAPLPLHSTVVAALTIARDGTDAQRGDGAAGRGAQGEAILTWAFTEQDPRFLPETIRTAGGRRRRRLRHQRREAASWTTSSPPISVWSRAAPRRLRPGSAGPLAVPGRHQEPGHLPHARSSRWRRTGRARWSSTTCACPGRT